MISNTSSTRNFNAAPRKPYILPQKTKFSRADKSGYNAISCGTTPRLAFAASGSFVTECPIMEASPLVGASKPESIEIVVLFPAPFGPSRLNTSPESALNFASCTACRSPNDFLRFLTSIANDMVFLLTKIDRLITLQHLKNEFTCQMSWI